jgi:hypothetical protein
MPLTAITNNPKIGLTNSYFIKACECPKLDVTTQPIIELKEAWVNWLIDSNSSFVADDYTHGREVRIGYQKLASALGSIKDRAKDTSSTEEVVDLFNAILKQLEKIKSNEKAGDFQRSQSEILLNQFERLVKSPFIFVVQEATPDLSLEQI